MNIIEYGALTESYGGIESYIKNQIGELSDSDLHFDFLVPNEKNKLAYEDYFSEQGCKVYRKYERWQNAPVGHFRDLYNFFKSNAGRYDIAIANYLDLQNINFLIMAKLFGIKTIAHSHSSGAYRNKKKKLLVILNRFLALYFIDNLFSCSHEAAEWMFGKYLLKYKPLTIIKNKIDAKKFVYDEYGRTQIRVKNNIPVDAVVLGHTGRLSPGKNHSFMIDVFYEFKRIYSNSYLIFVGDGELIDKLKEKSRNLGISDSILFAGKQNNIGEWLSSMDIFLFPSDHEGLPLSLIEAQTSGVRCILSEHIPKEAIITNLCDVVPLAMGAKYWAMYISKMAKYERSSRINATVDNGYDVSKSKTEYIDVYKLLINRM